MGNMHPCPGADWENLASVDVAQTTGIVAVCHILQPARNAAMESNKFNHAFSLGLAQEPMGEHARLV
jgi:hypothetical protein